MKYYKIIGKTKNSWTGNYDNIYSHSYRKGVRVSEQYVPNTLFTQAELKKVYGITPENIKEFPFIQPYECSSHNTYWFFGYRWECGTNCCENK